MAAVTNEEGNSEESSIEEAELVFVIDECEKSVASLLESVKQLPGVVVEFNSSESAFTERSDLSHLKFVVNNFDTDLYTRLRKISSKIYGPPIVEQCLRQQKSLPSTARPLYCNFMNKLVTCFTGYKIKEELARLIELVHHMGGSVRKDFSPSVTHLIAISTSGEKYQYAVNLGIPVFSPEWVYKCWEYRNEVDFDISSIPENDYRVPPFLSCKIAFWGFPVEEQAHMEEITISNGGTFCSTNEPGVTHVVVSDCINSGSSEDEQQKSALEISKLSACIVRVEWFWISIQINARAGEHLYFAKVVNENVPTNLTPYNTATGSSRAKKRKRLKETLGQLASLSDLDNANLSFANSSAIKHRRSEELTCSPSILDTTVSPISSDENAEVFEIGEKATAANTSLWAQNDIKSVSPRMQVACELLQTESNYVGILHTIITMVKEPIEDVHQVGGALLDPTEVKIIFGNVRPIYDVHVKLKEDLAELINTWKEDKCIGNIIVKYSQELLRAYPPFINFFEKTKEMLIKCDTTKPRFHAFLKLCQGKPEFGRQSLVELLIRPVQRLPSVILLLTDLLKHTNKSNPDHAALDEALKCLKDVMVNINEDKRKTEGQLAMFKLVNDIENCPANLLSSHRHLITSADVIELGNCASGKGVQLTLFLFTDVLEICKRRKYTVSGASSTLSSSAAIPSPSALVVRSASVVSLHSGKSYQKRYKHIEMLPLSHIKLVANVNETEDCHNVFALVCRGSQDTKERLYSFALVMDELELQNGGKLALLRTICRNVANVLCRQDVDSFIKAVDPMDLDIISSDMSTKTLSKAARFASKTSKKVGRVLSLTSKTPRRLTRAVSTMISPLTKAAYDSPDRDPFATPLALAAKRFPCASTLNLQSYESPSTRKSSATEKKIKSFTFGPSSLMKRTRVRRRSRRLALPQTGRKSSPDEVEPISISNQTITSPTP